MAYCCRLLWITVSILVVVFSICDEIAAKPNSFEKALGSLKDSAKGSSASFGDSKIRSRRQVKNVTFDDGNDQDSEEKYSMFYRGPVCELIDARNTPADLKKDLENCTIVNGFVHIMFINDHSDPKLNIHDMNSYSFPNLRVITEHLLIYRVYGLTSLRNLFPNLVMIGGQRLFHNYAMVLYENPELTEIGLGSLQYIKHGTVRIQNNGKLCFLGTLDWGLLGKGLGNEEIASPVLIDNKVYGCIDQCGDPKCKFKNENGVPTPYCWGVKLCQKRPYTCENEDRCDCHSECLGGCSSPNNASACYACKTYYFNETCVTECPKNTHLANKWRCVGPEHCIKLKLIFHDGECLVRCPQHHRKKGTEDRFVCEKCDGSCAKVCDFEYSHTITDMHSLFQVRRCTIIKAPLIISVTGADLTEQLEDALGVLQEVDSLVIRRSDYLTSLSFLKNLRRITGERKSDGYSIYVLDNKRLRDLWDFHDGQGESTLRIDGGKAFFHFNPFLCLKTIDKIANLTEAVEDINDISLTTNGDRITCDMDPIENVTIEGDSDASGGAFVILSWKTPVIKDHRTLIGFHVYFKVSEFENASRFEEDSSGKSSWSIKDVDRNSLDYENPLSETWIHGLTPYTKYAFFIATYTTAAARKGAQSDIYYYKTAPSRPSFPRSVKLISLNHSAITVSWQPPQHPNGNISHYIVRWKRQQDDLSVVNLVDTCIDNGQSLRNNDYYKNQPENDEKEPSNDKNTDEITNQKCCSCDKRPTKSESDILESTTFEDFLINSIIYGRDDSEDGDNDFGISSDRPASRKKRSIDLSYLRYKRSLNGTLANEASWNTTSNTSHTTPPSTTPNNTVNPHIREPEKEMQQIEVNYTTFTITGLHHFTEYYFEVVACNHAFKDVGCGTASISTRRTKKLATADKISSKLGYRRNDKGDGFLYWEPPISPNSFIKFYTISLAKHSEAPKNRCCSAMEFNRNHSCKLVGLTPGTYVASVRPVSLAATGEQSAALSLVIESPPVPDKLVGIGIATGITLAVCMLCIILWLSIRKRCQPKKPPIYASVNPEYSSVGVYEPDEYEISPDDIQLIREIGHGHFGKVYEGLAQKIIYGQSETQVAVKTLHGNEGGQMTSKRIEFLKEAGVMKAFNAHHVVRLLGVVSTSQVPMVVMEFMEHGDLKTYLRSTRPDAENRQGEPPTLQLKLQMCGEIADGMAYLSARKFVHRDLAARNCLVHKDMTVKIGDFGLTRDVYETDYYRIDSRGILPVRWMAPESLKDGVFDARSDVWSFGVVLWEIATLAEQPYQGQQHDQVTRFVIDGGYMEQPKDCPKKLYDLMLMCWHYSPSMRPTFMEIVSSLSPDLSEKFKQVSFVIEQKNTEEAAEKAAEDEAFIGDSPHSSNSALCTNSSDGKGSVQLKMNNHLNSDGSNFRYLNGKHHGEQNGGGGERGDALSEKEDSVRYISHPIQTQLHSSTMS